MGTGNDISILLVSAYDWTQIEEDAKQAGVNGFISKPLFRSSLFKKISEVLKLEENTAAQEENNSDLADMNILVVEDMDVNWEVISTLLEMYGIKSQRAENGKIEFFEKEFAFSAAFVFSAALAVSFGTEKFFRGNFVARLLSEADFFLSLIEAS